MPFTLYMITSKISVFKGSLVGLILKTDSKCLMMSLSLKSLDQL